MKEGEHRHRQDRVCGEKKQGAIAGDGKNDQGQMINIGNVSQKPLGRTGRSKGNEEQRKKESQREKGLFLERHSSFER